MYCSRNGYNFSTQLSRLFETNLLSNGIKSTFSKMCWTDKCNRQGSRTWWGPLCRGMWINETEPPILLLLCHTKPRSQHLNRCCKKLLLHIWMDSNHPMELSDFGLCCVEAMQPDFECVLPWKMVCVCVCVGSVFVGWVLMLLAFIWV